MVLKLLITKISLSHEIRAWGHPLKPRSGRFRADARNYFFTQCLIEVWNSLLTGCGGGCLPGRLSKGSGQFHEGWSYQWLLVTMVMSYGGLLICLLIAVVRGRDDSTGFVVVGFLERQLLATV